MKKIESLEEIKQIGLRGLDIFDEFCRNHGIKYSLAAGTMIGAVRHKGFIPWDDDIDLYMERKEYDKLLDIVRQGFNLENEDYEIYLPEREGYVYPFAKVINKNTVVYEKNILKEYAIGVWIDIFPIDNCGETIEEAEKNMKYMAKLSSNLRHSVSLYQVESYMDILKNIYVILHRCFSSKSLSQYKSMKLTFEFPKGDKYKGLLIWPYVQPHKLYDIYPAEYFEGYMEIEFEGKNYMIFSHYDEILHARYGDYMKLPPIEAQVAHDFCAYYKD